MQPRKKSVHRLSLALIVILVVSQAAVGYLILKDRFSFVNLVDVETVQGFDDPRFVVGSNPRWDLGFPTTSREFNEMIVSELGSHTLSDSEKFEAAILWVYSQLQTPNLSTADTILTPRDAWVAGDVLIASREGIGFWCDTYSRLTVATSTALDIPARVIWLDGHVVVERFDQEKGQWIAADPTMPGLIVHPDTGKELSFAEAASLVRQGRTVEVRVIEGSHPTGDVKGLLQYLNKVLGRDLLVYVDGTTAVSGNSLPSLIDWLVGKPRGVRLVSEESAGRVWKRRITVLNLILLFVLGLIYFKTSRAP